MSIVPSGTCPLAAAFPALRSAPCRANYGRRSAAKQPMLLCPERGSGVSTSAECSRLKPLSLNRFSAVSPRELFQAPEARLSLARHEAERSAGTAAKEIRVPEGRLTYDRRGHAGLLRRQSSPLRLQHQESRPHHPRRIATAPLVFHGGDRAAKRDLRRSPSAGSTITRLGPTRSRNDSIVPVGLGRLPSAFPALRCASCRATYNRASGA
jgi:hypothetical protein